MRAPPRVRDATHGTPPARTPHTPPTHRAPDHAAHGAAPALARVRPITAAHLPGAPQEEREDLLDVLAQELASAVHTELRGRTYTKVRARDRDRVRGDRRVRR